MRKITKIAIFDFDGTLVDSPLPDTGKPIFKEKTGKEWPHIGWFGKAESLDIDVFDIPLIDSVKEAYDALKLEEETLMVMLTGRRGVLAKEVERIIEAHELVFDEYHYNNGGATEDAKMKTMDRLLIKYQDVTEMIMFDDRLIHIPLFHDFLMDKVKTGRLEQYDIVVVPTERH